MRIRMTNCGHMRFLCFSLVETSCVELLPEVYQISMASHTSSPCDSMPQVLAFPQLLRSFGRINFVRNQNGGANSRITKSLMLSLLVPDDSQLNMNT